MSKILWRSFIVLASPLTCLSLVSSLGPHSEAVEVEVAKVEPVPEVKQPSPEKVAPKKDERPKSREREKDSRRDRPRHRSRSHSRTRRRRSRSR